jgi:predicted nucleic acid-binding protein
VNPEDVPAGPLILDTDVFSYLAWQRGPWQDFEPLVAGHPLVLTFVNVGELLAGGLIAGWGEARMTKLRDQIRRCVILPSTAEVTEQWSHLHARFRGQLGTSGGNDMWIAACAMTQAPPLPIVTNNLSDFDHLSQEFPIQLVHPDL